MERRDRDNSYNPHHGGHQSMNHHNSNHSKGSSSHKQNRPRRRSQTNNKGKPQQQQQPPHIPNHNNNNHNHPAPHRSASLETTLRELGCYDDAQEARRRGALDVLEKILYQWSMDICRDGSNPWQRPRVAVITFGSYRLGVHRPSSDLDVLALSPPHCSRADFFDSLVVRLQRDARVAELHPIATAYTPVIKFVLQGIQIDLLFARLQDATKLFQYQQSQPSLLGGDNEPPAEILRNPRIEYSIDDSDLMGLDAEALRSINGSRVSQCMLSLVPNAETFRMTLRAIKAWADIHGVQSNVLGFLGGINWAILVCRVAMDHPQADPPQLLKIFFRTYSQWKWPEPVTLGPICTEPPPGVMPMPAWNPQANPRDGLHLMPIITPVFPSMNSAYNIGIPQLRRIQDEMCRAAYCLENAPEPGDCTGLFRDGGFFRRHSNYLQINIRARNPEDFLHWSRLCESKMRLLIACLETSPEVQAWPFSKFFDRRYGTTHESYFFVALRFAPEVETVDLRYSTSEFLHKINSWEGRKGGMDLSIARVSADDLPPFVVGKGAPKNPAAEPANQNYNSANSNGHPPQNQQQQQQQQQPPKNNKPPTIDISLCPRMVPEQGSGSPLKRPKHT